MSSETVYNFLKDQCRPFSANDILQNVGKEHGKTAILNSLHKLVQKNKVMEKVYGKQKIYCVVEDENINPAVMEDELKNMDREINNLKTNKDNIKKQLYMKLNELRNYETKLTLEQANIKKNVICEEIMLLYMKLDVLKDGSDPISEEEKSEINDEHEKYLKEYKKRKRICMDVINSIMESYPKTKKHLFEEIGIETDEDVEFSA